MIEKLKKVYNMLEDKESKDIWLHRLNYILTSDKKYIYYIVERYTKYSPKTDDIYNEIINRFGEKDIILYGVGNDAIKSFGYWSDKSNVKCYCDRDVEKQANGFYSYNVISLEKLAETYTDEVIVITSSEFYAEIQDYLIKQSIPQDKIIMPYEYSYISDIEKQYFDEKFISLGNEEIFVDAGAYDLMSTIRLQKKCNSVKKSYAFEPDPENFNRCMRKKQKEDLSYIEVFPFGTYSSKTELKFVSDSDASALSENGEITVPVVKIDEVCKDKITFIKMDVEGSELESLKGASELIIKYKPKLAICIYHKPEDIYTIPLYIKSLVSDYKFYIRHYSNYAGETVLYAV